jgi:2-keto-myo-inositol isomerase
MDATRIEAIRIDRHVQWGDAARKSPGGGKRMRAGGVDFAINHMTVAGMGWRELLALAGRTGCVGVEFRNDFAGRTLFDGDPPEAVRAEAAAAGVRMLALAEVKRFNDWSDARSAEALSLMRTARACGAEAVSLIPANDGSGRANGERQANLRIALRHLRPMLEDHDLIGMIEPLGFETCALRFKEEAIAAVEGLDARDRFRLVHDTFHHHLADDGQVRPAHTGNVHLSGVVDRRIGVRDMADAHRVLVDAEDRLGNVEQIAALLAGGYAGPFSFECFAPEVHALPDPERALVASMEFIRSRLERMAA